MQAMKLRTMKHQRGVTLGGLMFFMLLVGFFVYAAFRVIPGYIDHWTISKIMTNVATQPDIADIKDRDIRLRLGKELRLNNVKTIAAEDISIERTASGVRLYAEFSMKQHFMGPVSLYMDFKPEAATP